MINLLWAAERQQHHRSHEASMFHANLTCKLVRANEGLPYGQYGAAQEVCMYEARGKQGAYFSH